MSDPDKVPVDPPPKYEPPPNQGGGFSSGAGAPYPPAQGAPYPPPQGSGYPPPQGSGYPPPQGSGYPPPQGSAYPATQGQHTTVVVTQPMTGPLPGATCRYGQYPACIVCQHCQATVTTSMAYETGLLTWAIAGLICLFGLWFGCCLIPFCIDGTKDVEHRCPNCNNVVGKFRHFS